MWNASKKIESNSIGVGKINDKIAVAIDEHKVIVHTQVVQRGHLVCYSQTWEFNGITYATFNEVKQAIQNNS